MSQLSTSSTLIFGAKHNTMKEWAVNNLFQIITVIFGGGSFFAFVTERRKRKIEESQLQASALAGMQKTYDKWVEDSNQKFASINKELYEVKNENIEQRKDLRLLQKDNSKLHLEISKLLQENTELKRLIEVIKKENKELNAKLQKYEAQNKTK